MLLIARQLFASFLKLGDLHHDTVNASTGETLTEQIHQKRVILAFATLHYGCQYLEPCSLFELHHLVDDLLRGLFSETLAIIHAMLDPDAGKEQAQIVVYLGDGAHSGARVARSRLLVDGNCG